MRQKFDTRWVWVWDVDELFLREWVWYVIAKLVPASPRPVVIPNPDDFIFLIHWNRPKSWWLHFFKKQKGKLVCIMMTSTLMLSSLLTTSTLMSSSLLTSSPYFTKEKGQTTHVYKFHFKPTLKYKKGLEYNFKTIIFLKINIQRDFNNNYLYFYYISDCN